MLRQFSVYASKIGPYQHVMVGDKLRIVVCNEFLNSLTREKTLYITTNDDRNSLSCQDALKSNKVTKKKIRSKYDLPIRCSIFWHP